jgi:hypothetical protein
VHLTYYAKNKGQMSAQIPYRTDGGFVKWVWGLYFRTAARMERNHLSDLFSDLDTYIWLKIQHALSQKGSECKQFSHALACTFNSVF